MNQGLSKLRKKSGRGRVAAEQLEARALLTGSILHEFWTGIAGGNVSNLTTNPAYPDHPAGADLLGSFQSTGVSVTNFGERIRGILTPPQTGPYTFYIAGDASAQLSLSNDADPANEHLIATVASTTGLGQWTLQPQQQSQSITLNAGSSYFIDAILKETAGNGNLAVAWTLPDGTFAGPIGGQYLAPIVPTVQIWDTQPIAAEGDAVPGIFTVTRSGGSLALPVSVNYSLSGSAINGVDYQVLSGSVTIPAGAASAPIHVLALSDSANEANESLNITLTAGSGYTLALPQEITTSGTILSNNTQGHTGASLLPANPLASATLSNATYTKLTAATVTGMPFTSATVVQTTPPNNTYSLNVTAKTSAAFAKGDAVYLQFYARSMNADGSAAQFTARLAQTASPFTTLLSYQNSAGVYWRKYEVAFSPSAAYAAGAANLVFNFTGSPQSIEIGGVSLLDFGTALAATSLAATPVVYDNNPNDAWRAAADTRIDQDRKGNVSVLVTDAAGNPIPGAVVNVDQVKQDFGFGVATIGHSLVTPDDPDVNNSYRYYTQTLLNRATQVYNLKWPWWEMARQEAIDSSIWLPAHGVDLRGHNLVWPGWKYVPTAVQTQYNATLSAQGAVAAASWLQQTILAHITDEVTALKGVPIEWDVMNEPYAQNALISIVGQAGVAQWYRAAKAADPNARLFMNDYDIIGNNTGHQANYTYWTQYLQSVGAGLGGLGEESHFQPLVPTMSTIQTFFNTYSQFNLPIEITEFEVNTKDEQLQADYTRDYMTQVFSQPSANGFVSWEFWDGRTQIPGTGMFRTDWSLRPWGQEWKDLTQAQWWTNAQGTTWSDGTYNTRAFTGTLDVTVTVGGQTRTQRISLTTSGSTINVVMGTNTPTQPTNLSAAYSSNGIALNWTDPANDNSGVVIERSTDNRLFQQIDSIPAGSTSYVDQTAYIRTQYYYRVRALGNSNVSAISPAVGIDISRPPSVSNVFAQHADIGAPTVAGTSGFSGGTYTVAGAGVDIAAASDQFQYDFTTTTGDTNFVARIADQQNTNSWAKAGIMIRADSSAGAAYAALVAAPGNNINFQWRTTAGGTTQSVAAPIRTAPQWLFERTTPQWVQLTRAGDTFSAYVSEDGNSWTLIGSATIAMNATVQAGLAVTSHAAATTSTAHFDHVYLTPLVATPTISLSGNTYAHAGGTYTLNLGPVNDPGNTVLLYLVHWGDGSSSSYFTNGPVTHTYTTPGSATITVDLTDQNGTFTNAGSLPVIVSGAPTLSIAGNSNANVGGAYALTLGAVIDPGYAVSQYTVHWGDGSATVYTTGGLVTHTYAGSGPANISADLTDSTGTFGGAGALALTVNPSPSIILSGNSGALAGTPYTLTLGAVTDVGYTVSQFTVHWGDGSINTYGSAGAVTHAYTGSGPATIAVDLSDAMGTYVSAGTLNLSIVSSSAPTMAVSGNSNANAGGTYTLTLGNPVDPLQVLQYLVHWGDGQSTAYTAPGAVTHTYTTPGAPAIRVDLTDTAGTYVNVASLALTVNPAPTIALSGNSSVAAGSVYTLTLGAVSDPGYSVSQYVVHWGDGASDTYGSAGPVTHTYAVSGSASISVDLTDPTGVFSNAGSLNLTLLPSATPTAALSGNSNANAGGVYTLTIGNPSDPLPILQYVVHWGDGSSGAYTSAGAVTHTYATSGPANITVDLTDSNATYTNAGALPITVNPAPTITLSGNISANAGGAYTLNLGAVTDPGYSVSQYLVHWGDGSTGSYLSTGAVTHTYSKPGIASITVDLTDQTGVYVNGGHLSAIVSNSPTVAVGGNSRANAGGSYSFQLGTASDPGYSILQYVVHWGDGKNSAYTAGGLVTHTYATVGPVSITVDLTDTAGTYTKAGSLALTVNPSPTIALTGASSVNSGAPYTLNLGNVSDPGYTVSQYVVKWGDGTTNTYTSPGSVTHTYASPGSAAISVALTDQTGTYSNAGAVNLIVIGPPTIALSGNANANVKGTYTLTLGTPVDPLPVSKYLVHWGDGSTSTYTSPGAVTHTYATAGPANITVDLTDSSGTYAKAGSLALTVNPAPTIALSGATNVPINTAYSLTLGAVTDPGYGVSQYIVHWGDGATSTYSAAGVVTHTYTAANLNTPITVDLTDATGTFVKAGSLNLAVTSLLPNPFTSNLDIGAPALTGWSSLANGVFTVTGAGADIAAKTDQFHYLSKTVTGNTTISAKITGVANTNALAKAGVMVRNGAAANAAFASIFLSPGGSLTFEYRTVAAGATTSVTLAGKAIPQSVKLVRSANTFTAYYLVSGVWKKIGSTVSITMASTVNTGLAVTSKNTAKTCTATFSSVVLS